MPIDTRRLNGLIAEKAMGLQVVWTAGQPFLRDHRKGLPAYYTDMQSVWPLAIWLKERWNGFVLQWRDDYQLGKHWICKDADDDYCQHVGPRADTPELAIFLAVAKEIEVYAD